MHGVCWKSYKNKITQVLVCKFSSLLKDKKPEILCIQKTHWNLKLQIFKWKLSANHKSQILTSGNYWKFVSLQTRTSVEIYAFFPESLNCQLLYIIKCSISSADFVELFHFTINNTSIKCPNFYFQPTSISVNVINLLKDHQLLHKCSIV